MIAFGTPHYRHYVSKDQTKKQFGDLTVKTEPSTYNDYKLMRRNQRKY